MQDRMTNNNFSVSWVFSLIMMITTPAMADSNDSHEALKLAAEQSNPWEVPQSPRQEHGSQPPYQAMPKYYKQDDLPESQQRRQQNKIWRDSSERFVTPEILESLKRQQQKHQVMPENQRLMNDRRQPQPQRYMQMPPASGVPGQGAFGLPSYGGGSANPLYDAPAVSPWGDGADVLYRGESFPMVPREALGGFAPMHVPSFDMNTYNETETAEPAEADKSNVFNPFTFLPGGGLGQP